MSHLTLSIGTATLADRLFGRGLATGVVLIAAGVALTSIAAQITTPAWPIPMTGQILAVLVVGMALGSLRGAISMALYALGGGLGMPIFSNSSSGLDSLTGPAGGYIAGFVGAAAFVGWVAQRGLDRTFPLSVASAAGGTAIIFLAGVPRLAIVGDLSLSEAAAAGFLPLVAGGVVTLVVAALVNIAAWAGIERMERRDADRSESAV